VSNRFKTYRAPKCGKKIERAFRAGAILAGALSLATVRHGADCPKLAGGACQYDADVEVTYPTQRIDQ
jgi:hypothetical protein